MLFADNFDYQVLTNGGAGRLFQWVRMLNCNFKELSITL